MVLDVANVVAVSEFPVTSPVTSPVIFPANPLAVTIPVFELKVRFVLDLAPRFPLAAVENNKLQLVSVASFAIVIAVATAAVPLVSWLPLVLTPGKSIFALPSNDTPPMVLAVANVVAVAAFPLVSWVPLVLTPGS